MCASIVHNHALRVAGLRNTCEQITAGSLVTRTWWHISAQVACLGRDINMRTRYDYRFVAVNDRPKGNLITRRDNRAAQVIEYIRRLLMRRHKGVMIQ
jgi:hypothetical protein